MPRSGTRQCASVQTAVVFLSVLVVKREGSGWLVFLNFEVLAQPL